MKWGYKTVHFELKKEGLLGGSFLDETEMEEQLNQFGQAGWELISVIEVQNGIICFFRQLLTPVSRRFEELLPDQEGAADEPQQKNPGIQAAGGFEQESRHLREARNREDVSGGPGSDIPEPELQTEPEYDSGYEQGYEPEYEIEQEPEYGKDETAGVYEDEVETGDYDVSDENDRGAMIGDRMRGPVDDYAEDTEPDSEESVEDREDSGIGAIRIE